jgi:hypothetical protein
MMRCEVHATVTQEEAIEIAKAAALQRGWAWTREVLATKRRYWFRPGYWWWIQTNVPYRGGNSVISLGDASGRILSMAFYAR